MARFIVREATIHDCDDIMRMIKEVATYQKMPEKVTITAQDLRKDGFGEKPLFHAFVAESTTEGNDGKRPLVGFVTYCYSYTSWYGKTCAVEDLYVTEEWRNKGIGGTLWTRVCQAALSMGCAKLNWIVINWNKLAIDFYKRRGAYEKTGEQGWLLYGMDRDTMKNLVDKTLPKAMNGL